MADILDVSYPLLALDLGTDLLRQGIKGWQGLVMVDGKAYNWMGNAPGPPTVDQLHMQYTSTRTIITMSVANQVELDVEFLSPFYVGDFKRQSIPFSYMQVTAKSTDGRSHHVQVYADVSGEWASGDNSKIIQWETDTKEGVRYHKFYRQDQNEFNEDGDSAAWGNWYWATGDQVGLFRVFRTTLTRHVSVVLAIRLARTSPCVDNS